ncbi:DUF3291 domain-containing protein [Thetidibacter halocola]|uniref:DUF3291 domain-containing protein n=1 Tax=Thetidibacter halocola TaxID=2827239 RepID=A0A8J8B7C8_9RHOB|nr:DUF3291 domain-containing protein [Thetidibacter halocola]MBS0124292.1 DUF3291 domain-containing protein [Thetidibacter halocola]
MSIAVHTYGLLKAPHGEPEVQAFVDGIATVYAVAERSKGYVWRFSDYETLAPVPVPAARTLSIWDDLDSLRHFVWDTLHGKFYARKSEWFHEPNEPMMVLWNTDPAARPTMEEAYEKLEFLRANGPSPAAFDWQTAEKYTQ